MSELNGFATGQELRALAESYLHDIANGQDAVMVFQWRVPFNGSDRADFFSFRSLEIEHIHNYETAKKAIAAVWNAVKLDKRMWPNGFADNPDLMQIGLFVLDVKEEPPCNLILMCHWFDKQYAHLTGFGMGMANHNGGAR